MPKQARVGDKSEGWTTHNLPCCPHFVTGVFINGANDHKTNNLDTVVVGSEQTTDCPHCSTGIAITGSSSYSIDNKASHRIGDLVETPCGILTTVTGSSDQDIGG